MKRKKILVVDYSVAVSDDLLFCYEAGFGEEYEFILAEDLEEGLAKIKNQTPDLIISEICLFSTKHRSEKEKQGSRSYSLKDFFPSGSFPLTCPENSSKKYLQTSITCSQLGFKIIH